MKQITFHLSTIRKNKKISTRKLAELCGISVRSVERIESGSVRPLFETMCKIADALEVPITELFSYE